MRNSGKWLAALLLLSLAGPLCAGDKNDHSSSPRRFFFHKGDRIVFLGDSITEQYQYSTDIELYLTTRFPRWKLTFINAGISGDTAWGGINRFAEHVLAEKPTAVTIDFGMNDGGYGQLDKNQKELFAKHTRGMLEAARKAGVRVALISPNVVDWRNQPKFTLYRETQKSFYAPLKALAAEYYVPFVDQYAVTRAVIEKLDHDQAKQVNPFPDGVHTSGQGGLLMAHTILVGMHAPALVSDATIDAAAGKAMTKHCMVQGLRTTNQAVAFDRLDEALPLPVQKDWLPILPYVKQLEDFNWYGLKVTGLDSSKYALRIDGMEVASYTAEQLSKGVNLGNLTSGPIFDQGNKVFSEINAKNDRLVHPRFRSVVMFQAPDWLADVAAERKPKELAKRMKQIDEKQEMIYKLAQPRTHHFELKAVN